jgi:GPN-loop GTPase
MTTFGQLVCGPPGCGKSTYCMAMQQFFNTAGRPTTVVNLDPANDALRYECGVNVTDLISLTDVMDEHGLGPNGGLFPLFL